MKSPKRILFSTALIVSSIRCFGCMATPRDALQWGQLKVMQFARNSPFDGIEATVTSENEASHFGHLFMDSLRLVVGVATKAYHRGESAFFDGRVHGAHFAARPGESWGTRRPTVSQGFLPCSS